MLPLLGLLLFGIEFIQCLQHRLNILTRHSRTRAGANGENDSFAATFFENIQGGVTDFFLSAADLDLDAVGSKTTLFSRCQFVAFAVNILNLNRTVRGNMPPKF